MPQHRPAWGGLTHYLRSPAYAAELAAVQEALSRARDALREAEQRAAVAEQSAKDAWLFAKMLHSSSRLR